ncbi:hypothetical protein CAPTEDRAFT_197884 [Capitella teleta]|uniref:Uncharacterized protein n=1 Tax=Capitella teleta TaxID=283909 RepID=R7UCH2_CAPTE|nr:hypothetical protein CAPTEDRAFT_197884 [Capitella teleta]|eukprot:ELU01473.1 hypothetical protein CAPTEDRAFT_197884 [Capitella teleta]
MITSKLADLQSLITTTKPVFVCITEALPKHHNIPDPVDLLTIQNFTLHNNFNKPNLNRGIAIYVQNGIEPTSFQLAFKCQHCRKYLASLSSINVKLNQILMNQEKSDNLIAATTQKLRDFDHKLTSLTSQVKTVALTQKQTSTTIKALDERISNIEQQTKHTIKETFKTCVDTAVKETVQLDVASAFATFPPTPPPAPGPLDHEIHPVLKEHELQKSRKLNLIIYNEAHSQEERLAKDAEAFKAMCQAINLEGILPGRSCMDIGHGILCCAPAYYSIRAEDSHCPIAVKTIRFTASPRIVIASLHAFGSGLSQINR